ncbi:hypothetical protein GCM10007901_45360 [Dyella acidisoli]|uniref:Uncharacterized protein n=2 Tax=Dyella acidisoli TaxID=1867834 RepID=A0ABQ5XYS9_9GAMM|nr:hypothetical protein GCM10007901_45360 [Dyella acidisoli]
MNFTDLTSHLLPPTVGDVSAVQAPVGQSVSAELRAATGNQLLELDVWGRTSAAERTLSTHAVFDASPTSQLDQLVNHILAPLD